MFKGPLASPALQTFFITFWARGAKSIQNIGIDFLWAVDCVMSFQYSELIFL